MVTASRSACFAAAALWGILSPLNVIKILLKKTSPYAYLWVPQESESCMFSCGISQMWGTLFWSTQFAFAVGFAVLALAPTAPRTLLFQTSGLQRIFVCIIMVKAYLDGFVREPIAILGCADALFGVWLLTLASSGENSAAQRPAKERNSRLQVVLVFCALAWGIVAPFNVVKVWFNKRSPLASVWIPEHSQSCQALCGIARMFAMLFWASQFALALTAWRLSRSGIQYAFPLAHVLCIQKIFVAVILLHNYVQGVVGWPIAAFGVLEIVLATVLAFAVNWSSNPPQNPKQGRGSRLSVLQSVKAFAGWWWYPWLVGIISGINTFTIVLSTPLVGMYIAGVMARPSRLFVTAFANAFGATVGFALLVHLIDSNGTEWISETFPSIFKSSRWERVAYLMREYGAIGAVLVSAIPIVLHPLALFAVLADTNRILLFAAVLLGRTIKYIAMGWCSIAAPRFLKFFGKAAIGAVPEKDAKKKA